MARRVVEAKLPALDTSDPNGLGRAILDHLGWMRSVQLSERTVESRGRYLATFCAWCSDRSLTRPTEVSRAVLERYRQHLFARRQANDKPLSARTQYSHLHAVRGFFRWATRQNRVLYNPASELEMPKLPWQLPRDVMSVEEVERVMAQPNLLDPLELRDRAMLEVFYSTAIRRTELCCLSVWDVDRDRGTVFVREGKGRRDRVVPIGERALAWLDKYLADVRPLLVCQPAEDTLFLQRFGEPLSPSEVGSLVRRYFRMSELGKPGGCHLFRHTAATLMLEGGADIRFIQEMLGHSSLAVTHVYTRVAVERLKQVHTATHPGATNRRHRSPSSPSPLSLPLHPATPLRRSDIAALFAALAAEAREETGEQEVAR